MRQFLFNSAIVSSLATGVSLLRRTLLGPLNWRVWLLWASWTISLVLAVASVMERKKS